MGDVTGIQWTDHTFNPWMGCQRVSPGCERCYAETLVTTRLRLPVWGPPKTTERKRTAVANWRKPLAWDRAAAKAGKRARVFCASLADVFEDHSAVAPWRAELFALIEQTPHLDWQLLTKRPENLSAMLPASWLANPRPNVWLGTTVEDQRRAYERIAELLRTPAAVRFLSCEPLLESVELETYCYECDGVGGGVELVPGDPGCPSEIQWPCDHCATTGRLGLRDGISWVIVGGESGAGARPFDLEWARSIARDCRDAGVPVFVKQMGRFPVDRARGVDYRLADPHGGDPAEWPEDLRVRQMPEVRA